MSIKGVILYSIKTNFMNKHIFTLLLILLSSLSLFAQNPPNIILILTDDQGWNGTSHQMLTTRPGSKSDYYITPNVERLALKGMTFSQGYAPAPKCAPTRHSVLTGMTPARAKKTTVGNGASSGEILVAPTISMNINTSSITFPEVIKQVQPNYLTAHYGKWHLGISAPNNHGFDRHDGANGNNVGNATNGQSIQNDPKKIFSLSDSAMNFMDDAVNANRPFYLQISHYAVHTALEATSSTFNIYSDSTLRPPGMRHNNPLYGAMTEDLDKGLGLILDKIDSLGIGNDTYIIYLSDNGAQNGQSNNNPLRGSKVFLYEGGIRVPFLIAGPNIPASSRSSIPIVGYDLYPTIIEWITGNTNDVPPEVDGTSLLPVLANGTTPLVRNSPMVFHVPHYDSNVQKKPTSALIEGNYKFYVNYETGSFELYDLDSDLRENTNLFTTLPAVATDMCIKLRDYLKSVNADMPTLDETHPNNPGTAPDADNDGLDDIWEFTELLTVAYDGTDDPDNDGLDNATEFANGTDPYQNSTNTQHQVGQHLFKVFPNPVKHQLTIQIPTELTSLNLQIQLTDLYGRNIQKHSTNGQSSIQMDIQHLPKGVFLVEMRNVKGQLLGIEKIMKQ